MVNGQGFFVSAKNPDHFSVFCFIAGLGIFLKISFTVKHIISSEYVSIVIVAERVPGAFLAYETPNLNVNYKWGNSISTFGASRHPHQIVDNI